MRTLTSAALAFIGIIMPVSAGAANWDSYSKSAYSGAGMNDFSISFHCTELGTEFQIKHEHFLGLHNRPVEVKMVTNRGDHQLNTVLRVLPHNDRVAYTSNAREIAEFLMGASSLDIFITPEFRNRKYDLFYLDGSDYAIYRVFENCGEPLDGEQPAPPAPDIDESTAKNSDIESRAKLSEERFLQGWYPPASYSEDLESYLRVTILENRRIKTKILQKSGRASFDRSIVETLENVYYFPAEDVAPQDEEGNKFFCIRVSGSQEVLVDFECEG